MGVDEAEHGGSTLRPGPRVEGDRLEAGRRADGRDPLFPFIRVLWLSAGVQEQFPAERATAALPFESGSGGALLRRRPLGTGRARFPGNRLGRALKA